VSSQQKGKLQTVQKKFQPKEAKGRHEAEQKKMEKGSPSDILKFDHTKLPHKPQTPSRNYPSQWEGVHIGYTMPPENEEKGEKQTSSQSSVYLEKTVKN